MPLPLRLCNCKERQVSNLNTASNNFLFFNLVIWAYFQLGTWVRFFNRSLSHRPSCVACGRLWQPAGPHCGMRRGSRFLLKSDCFGRFGGRRATTSPASESGSALLRLSRLLNESSQWQFDNHKFSKDLSIITSSPCSSFCVWRNDEKCEQAMVDLELQG